MRITLKLRGSLSQQGFIVDARLDTSQGQCVEVEGYLPDNLALVRSLEQWCSSYQGLTLATRAIRPYGIHIGGSIQDRREVCQQAAEQLSKSFQAWLKSDSFRAVSDQFLIGLSSTDTAEILLRTDDPLVRQLPWQQWELLSRYRNAEVVLAPTVTESAPNRQPNIDNKVRILAVLGNSDGIDTKVDREFLETLAPGETEVCVLPQPTPEKLQDKLWDQPWDIFFFAGHSRTEGQTGILSLNDRETISLEVLEEGLKRAIANGLEVAIFNSCDGLGLATVLERLSLPHLIVMRQPIPDAIAQKFLKSLLESLHRQPDTPLHCAVREARERLRVLETDYPCASHLPVLCRDPNRYHSSQTPPPTWRTLRTGGRIAGHLFPSDVALPSPIPKRRTAQWNIRQRLGVLLLASIFAVALVFGLRYFRVLQPYELRSYDHLLDLRPLESPDERLLLITIDHDDFEYQEQQGFSPEGHLSNEILSQLLDKLAAFNPRTVGIGILRTGSLAPYLQTRLAGDRNRIFVSCELPSFSITNEMRRGASPPTDIALEKTGFSNFLNEDVIRRQVIIAQNRELDSQCVSEVNFPFLLALDYLSSESQTEVWYDTASAEKFSNNDQVFTIHREGKEPIYLPRLTGNSGGYQKVGNANYQMLLNYRSLSQLTEIAPSISLRSLIEDRITDTVIQRLQGRLVIVGGIMPGSSESFNTPFYRQGRQIREKGAILYTHMASQNLSAVLDDRPLIWWWSTKLEYSWIFLWAMLGSLSTLLLRRPLFLGLVTAANWLGLFLCCHLVMNQAGWIPLVPAALGMGIAQIIVLTIIHQNFKVVVGSVD